MSSLSSTHGSRSDSVLVVTTTTFALATVFVIARIISRFGILRSRTADDWVMILAWFLAFGLSVTIDYATSRGLGKHDTDIPSSWLPSLRKSEYAFTILYNPALMATKTSILIFYLRLSLNIQNNLRIASYITLGVVNLAGVVLTFLNVFQCTPVSAVYDMTQSSTKCISIPTLYLCSAPVNIITDLAILVLPIPVLTGIRLPQRQKTILVITFTLGIFVTIVDVIRIYYLQQAVDMQVVAHQKLGASTELGQLGSSTDFAWNSSIALMWSAVEVNVGIICACIPTLKPLIKRIIPAMITDRVSLGSTAEKSESSSQVRESANSHRTDPIDNHVPALPHAREGADPEREMDMIDFLTVPGMEPGTINRTTTAHTHTTANSVYFGFVNMKRPKSMLKTKGMESFKYCTIVTILFFLWGFSYGLLNTLNNEIAKVAGESTAQELALSSAYFGAYLFGGLTIGQLVLRKAGFKATFITGLCIYGTGTLMFWPSAVLTSFPGFIISNFVVGLGLSILETAANPFLALCGPSYHSEFRLLLAQGVQAIASILSQLLAEKVLFAAIGPENVGLIDIQWTYLAIALLTVILALFFYYMPLPEAADSDLQLQAEYLGIYPQHRIFKNKLPLIYTTLALAIFANFLYVGGQEAMSVWFGELLTSIDSKTAHLALSVNNYTLLAHAIFAFSRLLFAFLSLIIKPRILLLISFIGCIISASLTTSFSSNPTSTNANSTPIPALLLFFFEGPIFPLIFSLGIRGLGLHAKFSAGLLTAATSGGAVYTWIMFAVQKLSHKSVGYSYVVIVAVFGMGTLFAVYVNVLGRVRWQVDSRGDWGLPSVEGEGRRDGDGNGGRIRGSDGGGVGGGEEKGLRRFSRRFSAMFEMVKGVNSKGGNGDNEGVVVEHRERCSG